MGFWQLEYWQNDKKGIGWLFKNEYPAETRLYRADICVWSDQLHIFNLGGGSTDYLYTQIVRKNKIVTVFYHKNDCQAFVFEKTKEDATFYPICHTDGFLLGIQPELIPSKRNFSPGEVVPESVLDEESCERKKNHTEMDNPFLVKYYFSK